MLKGWILVLLCAVASASAGCDRNDKTNEVPSAAGTSGQVGGNVRQTTAEGGDFVQRAALANMAEIQLGQLATTRAQSADVKQFAWTMVSEHTAALVELKQAAGDAGGPFPTELDDNRRAVQNRLASLHGAEFDREYMNVMVDTHQQVEDLLEGRAERATGTSGGATGDAAGDRVNQWAATTLPSVRMHLQRATDIKKNLHRS